MWSSVGRDIIFIVSILAIVCVQCKWNKMKVLLDLRFAVDSCCPIFQVSLLPVFPPLLLSTFKSNSMFN